MIKKIFNYNSIFFIFFIVLGLAITFHKVLLSGFDYIPGTNADGRFINYILEHIYSWVFGIGNHAELFSPPNYFPLKYTLFYSDTLISIAPLYIIFRFFNDAYVSYSLMVMSFFVLNFISFYFILKHFDIKPLYRSFGAYLYSFSLLNAIHVIHAQMLTQFFSVFGILCLLKINSKKSKYENGLLIILFGIMIDCQFLASYYLGFFLFFGIIIYAVLSIFFDYKNSEKKNNVLKFFRENKIALFLSLFVMGICLAPLGYAYYDTGMDRSFDDVLYGLEIFKSFFNSNSIIWGQWIPEVYRYREIYVSNFGYVTLICGLIGLIKTNKKLFLVAFIVLISLLDIGNYFILSIFYKIPGGCGIRFWYRVLYLVLPLITFGVIKFLSGIKIKYAIILCLIIFLEQIPIIDYSIWSRTTEKAKMQFYERKVPRNCEVITIDSYSIRAIYRWIDSMWFAHYRGVYSGSGYSGIMLIPKEATEEEKNMGCNLIIDVIPKVTEDIRYE